MVCKVCLEGAGNSDLRAMSQDGQSKHFSLKLHLLPTGLCLLLRTVVAKNIEVNTFKEDERDSIRGLLSS